MSARAGRQSRIPRKALAALTAAAAVLALTAPCAAGEEPRSCASTPQAAVRQIIYRIGAEPVVIARTNIDGDFAVILTRNGGLEGSKANAPILVERFAGYSNGRCVVPAEAITHGQRCRVRHFELQSAR